MSLSWVAWLAIAFLSGSVPFGYLFARWRGIDVRQVGSGNIGATNVARSAGRSLGLLTLAADSAKGVLPTWAAWRSSGSEELAAAVAVTATLGHVFSPWLRGRGGKGVATAAGAFGVVAPKSLIAALAVFAFVAWRTRYVSLASVSAALALPLACLLTGANAATSAAALLLAVLITARHRDNLRRLQAGTEPKFTTRR